MDDDTKSKVLLHGSKALGVASVILSAVAGVYLRVRCPALESPTFIGYVNVLSGGMFIAMALFHILPETLEHMPAKMQTLLTKNPSQLPCMVLVFLGFVMVLFFERVLLDAHGQAHSHGEPHGHALQGGAVGPRRSDLSKQLTGENDASSADNGTVSTAPSAQPLNWQLGQSAEPEVELTVQNFGSEKSGKVLKPVGARDLEIAGGIAKQGHDHHESHHHHDGHNAGTGAIMIMASLSVHSVFEGVVIGTAKTCKSVWLSVFIVVAHKWAAAMSIANHLTPQQRQTWVGTIILGIFSMTTPVGAVTGWVVGNVIGEEARIIECVLNSVGVGTLLYIGMVEVMPEEFAGSKRVWSKLFVLLAAVSLVFFLSWLHVDHGHCHDHGGCSGHNHDHNHGHNHDHGSGKPCSGHHHNHDNGQPCSGGHHKHDHKHD